MGVVAKERAATRLTPQILAIKRPGGRAERTLYDLSVKLDKETHGEAHLVDRRIQEERGDGIVAVTNVTEGSLDAMLDSVDPNWADVFEHLRLNDEQADNILEGNQPSRGRPLWGA